MIKMCLTAGLLISILSSVPAISQQVSPSGNKSLLWTIKGKGLAKPSYLFGSMDYVCPPDYFWSKSMQESFDKSEKVCFSLDVGNQALKTQAVEIFTDKHKHLKDYFTTAEYIAVKQFARDKMHLDLDPPKIQSLNPLAIQPFIVKQLLGCADPVSYESRILVKARKEGKKILGMETLAEYSIDIEATRFNDKIAEILVEMAKGSTYYRDYRNNIERAYQQQDIQRINSLFKAAKPFSKADLGIFLDEKNKRWLARMPAMMNQSPVFFLINSINMWGEEGLISLLRKAGYIVEPVH